VMRMIPTQVMDQCRQQVELEAHSSRPTNWVAGGVIILAWVAGMLWIGSWVISLWHTAQAPMLP
jgi:hypothetical protein